MRLYLMRHGVAIDRDDPECPPDPERYLTPKGIERTRAIAEGLSELGVAPTILLTSPYVRAVQTGEIVCEALGIDAASLQATDALKPDAKPARILEELGHLKFKDAICFGHAPHLDDLIAAVLRATASITSLKKGGVACLEMQTVSPALGQLRWLLTPKLLRRVGS